MVKSHAMQVILASALTLNRPPPPLSPGNHTGQGEPLVSKQMPYGKKSQAAQKDEEA